MFNCELFVNLKKKKKTNGLISNLKCQSSSFAYVYLVNYSFSTVQKCRIVLLKKEHRKLSKFVFANLIKLVQSLLLKKRGVELISKSNRENPLDMGIVPHIL